MAQWDKVWTFKTQRFEVGLEFGPEYDLDLSWDDDGDIRAGLESGALLAFVARVYVKLDGATVGEDYLGGCIYASERDFMQCGYFRDMVRCAIADARRHLASRPQLRDAA
jgi:hypothetical protein